VGVEENIDQKLGFQEMTYKTHSNTINCTYNFVPVHLGGLAASAGSEDPSKDFNSHQ
jgi:hypothetical protein